MPLVGCRTLGNFPADALVRAVADTTSHVASSRSYEDSAPIYDQAATETVETAPKNLEQPSIYTMKEHASEKKYINEIFILNFNSETLKFAAETEIIEDTPTGCKFIKTINEHLETTNPSNAEDYIRAYAADNYANTIHKINIEVDKPYTIVEANIYNCPEKAQRENNTVSNTFKTNSSEFDLFFGFYLGRNGLLKDLGETGPTLGFTYQSYYPGETFGLAKLSSGWHIHFNFDHFVDTNSTLLKPKFTNENFSNYLWSVGPSFRYLVNKDLQINYNPGLGINFLEIDTSGTNSTLSDEEATRTTISMVHQLGVYYRIENNIKNGDLKKSDTLFGINMLYYWMPNPLGEFANNNLKADTYGGGSYAIMATLKWVHF